MSLEDVQREAGFVMRSNHIGNDYPSNQAFVNSVENAEFVLYDRTTNVDTNYYPWLLKRSYESAQIAETLTNQLSPFFKADKKFPDLLAFLPTELQGAKTPAHLHYLSQKMLHPETLTFSEWLLKHEEIVTDIVNVLARSHQIFNRQVDAEGRAIKKYGVNPINPGEKVIDVAKCLRDAVVFGDQKPLEGSFIHRNEINVYLCMAIEAAKPENQREINGETWGYVLHGSGPDMIRYIKNAMDELVSMHESVIESGIKIPKKIYFGIIPTADLKIALPQIHQLEIDELVDSIKLLHQTKREKHEASSGAESRLHALNVRLRQLLHETVLSDIDLNTGFSTHSSHYDALELGPITLPQQLKSMSFEYLRSWNNHLLQIKNGLRNYAN